MWKQFRVVYGQLVDVTNANTGLPEDVFDRTPITEEELLADLSEDEDEDMK
jgi:hypothetical protein